MLLRRGKAESQPDSVVHLHFKFTFCPILWQYHFKDIKVEFPPSEAQYPKSSPSGSLVPCFTPTCFPLTLPQTSHHHPLSSNLWLSIVGRIKFLGGNWGSHFQPVFPPFFSSLPICPFSSQNPFSCSFLYYVNFYVGAGEKCSHWRDVVQGTPFNRREKKVIITEFQNSKREKTKMVVLPRAFFSSTIQCSDSPLFNRRKLATHETPTISCLFICKTLPCPQTLLLCSNLLWPLTLKHSWLNQY